MTADWLNVKHNTYNLQDSHPKGDSIDPNNPFICRSVQKKESNGPILFQGDWHIMEIRLMKKKKKKIIKNKK